MITEKNLVNHELIGLQVECIESSNPANQDIKGKVVNETKNMLWVEKNKETKKLEKSTCVFVFEIPSGKRVEINGSVLIGRPEQRLKKKVKQ